MAIIMGIAVAIIKIGGGGNLLLFFSLLFFSFPRRRRLLFLPSFLAFSFVLEIPRLFSAFHRAARPLYTRIAAYRQLARSPQERQSRRFTGTARAQRADFVNASTLFAVFDETERQVPRFEETATG